MSICYKCLEPLEILYVSVGSLSASIDYCVNPECDVVDGVWKDKENILGFGKNELVVHLKTSFEFWDKVKHRESREDEIKTEIWKDARLRIQRYQKRYYRTWDYRVIKRLERALVNLNTSWLFLVSSVKEFINERLTIKEGKKKKK